MRKKASVTSKLPAVRPGWTVVKITGFLCLAAGIMPGANEKRDPKAVEVANAMMQALGGEQAWNSAHFVRFDFKVNIGGKMVVDRSHLWDKRTGRYRLEQKTKTGQSQIVLMNLADQKGAVYEAGKQMDDAAAAKVLKAYGTFVNDVYWLSMPWKWMDAGVNLKFVGSKTKAGETCDVVQLTFNHVGLTPGDRYDAWVSQKSHLMTHWEYKLQSGDKGAWDWTYGDYHGVKLASDHMNTEGASINMGDVSILDSVDESVFSNPTKMLAGLKK